MMGWLDLLILFFCCIIEVFLLYDYFNNFFEIKIKRKYIKIVCAGIIGTIFFVNMLQNNMLNLILVPMVLWILVTVLFDSKFGIRFVYFIMAYIVMIGVEFLYIVLSNTTTVLLAKNRVDTSVRIFMAIITYKIFELYRVCCIKADVCKIKKKNDQQAVFGLFMCSYIYFGYYAYSILFGY